MFDFIEQHKRIAIGIAVLVILGLLTTLFVLNRKDSVPPTNSNTNNEADYNFLKDNISEEDKYVMLLGKIAAEDYGTYSKQDVRGLLDLKNQSTDQFKLQVQRIIDSIPTSKNIITAADPDSINISKNGSGALVSVNVVTEDIATHKKVNYKDSIQFVKEGDYWLVDKIVSTQI